jgi:localization factor PodJL
LRQITSQIASLHQPYEEALTALRSDLAEVARALTEAVPRRAIEQLENEVRTLAQRVDRSKQGGADPRALAGLEQGIAEIREALRHLMPAENLAGFEEVVRGLSHKIDQIASTSHDPGAFQQIEHAIHSMRQMVQNVASDGALAQLAAEVHGLSQRVEHAAHAAAQNSGGDALAKLEMRLNALMESGRSVPPELQDAIHALTERIDRIHAAPGTQLSHSDQLILAGLEDRIVKLAEKLDASDQRLNNLASMERGIADLLVMLEEMRNGSRGLRANAAPVAEAPSPQPAPPPVQPAPPPAPAAVAPPPPAPKHLPPVHHLEAPKPPDHVFSTIPPAASAQPVAQTAPQRLQDRSPIDPNLPPDTPLEPGAGMPRIKPGSAAARIAASEAALGGAKPAIAATGGAAAARAAARNAKSSFVDTPVIPPKNAKMKGAGGWFTKSPKKKKPAKPIPPLDIKPQVTEAPEIPPQIAAVDGAPAAQSKPRKTIGQHIKTVLIAASVMAIVLAAVQTTMNLLFPDDAGTTAEQSAPSATQAPRPLRDDNLNINTAPSTVPSEARPNVPARPMPTPEGTVPPDDTTNSTNRRQQQSFFDPNTVVRAPAPADVTGSIPKHAPRAAANSDNLPAAITGALRAGIAAQDPAAEYELAIRYFEGRGLTQNAEESVRWLDRAAKAGFVPAQFRLASAMEKGDGIKRDIQGARRLYIAAAEKGHAKAMHNLAVLYAEGIEGKPDYKMAAQWFRRAAALGVADSQFNLAILYARGIGTEQNLAESYKWFALAAAKGDQDAAKKRDEVGARLDQKNLTAARLAAQTFAPEPEPEDATNLRVPAGGWDRPAVAGAKSKPRTP